ncbi:histidine kinase [Sulfurospirillum sp. SCADC]|uniref:ArsS family sensor histidine kinase n=1 Tax=unclassified Sulfurospirillum TaxID=2618290 RepID=UPI000502A073|nr:histidine kinase [Sulfurospirillum sp. SCADC]
MRKTSIVTLVSIFFALTLVVINLAFAFEYKRQMSDLHFFTFQRFIMATKTMLHNDSDQEGTFLKLGIRISNQDKDTLLNKGEKLLEDPFSEMIQYHDKLYFVHQNPPPPMIMPMMRDDRFPPPPFDIHNDAMGEMPTVLENIEEISLYRLWILGGVINALLLLFFGIVLRKLLRLRSLKSAIRTFGDTKKFQVIEVDSEDELGEIASEFNVAMQKIHLLKEARTLFLRNILHELKTPIMKGKILSNSLENIKQQPQLERIFERLETLLGEMVKVEKLSSNEWILEAKEYRLVDVLDHAMDLLLLSDTKRIHIPPQEMAPLVIVDFELFATALKNVLDNALKHSTDGVEVDMCSNSISISSFGEKIPQERLDFSRAFNRTVEGSSSGLGLGLYIANAIVEKHGFRLSYLHVEGQNYFTIHFSPHALHVN